MRETLSPLLPRFVYSMMGFSTKRTRISTSSRSQQLTRTNLESGRRTPVPAHQVAAIFNSGDRVRLPDSKLVLGPLLLQISLDKTTFGFRRRMWQRSTSQTPLDRSSANPTSTFLFNHLTPTRMCGLVVALTLSTWRQVSLNTLQETKEES